MARFLYAEKWYTVLMKIARPRTLIDLKTGRVGSFASLPVRVNLARLPSRFPFRKLIQSFFLFLVVVYAFFGLAAAPNRLSSYAAQPTQEEREQLEKELDGLEQQIADYEATVSAYKKQGYCAHEDCATTHTH
jgi:hypothetical protein